MSESQTRAGNQEFKKMSNESHVSCALRASHASHGSHESSMSFHEFSCVSSKLTVCHAVTCHMSTDPFLDLFWSSMNSNVTGTGVKDVVRKKALPFSTINSDWLAACLAVCLSD